MRLVNPPFPMEELLRPGGGGGVPVGGRGESLEAYWLAAPVVFWAELKRFVAIHLYKFEVKPADILNYENLVLDRAIPLLLFFSPPIFIVNFILKTTDETNRI